MKNSSERSSRPLRGIAALFDDYERKELFRKYLFLLGWVEILILVVCWLYQLDRGYDRFGPVEIPFPWKVYFLVAFLAPIAITFVLGIVVVGFNKYFAEQEPSSHEALGAEAAQFPGDKTGRFFKLHLLVTWLQRLPFLALLLLLAAAVGIFYKIEGILSFVGNVGEHSVRLILISAGLLVILASIFGFLIIVLNFKLRKTSMEYQYKSEVAERFGLIILEDNTVLNSEGKLLINGKKFKDVVPMLPTPGCESSAPESAGSSSTLQRTVDLNT